MKTFKLISATTVVMSTVAACEKNERPNVVFIAVDDMRPDLLGCYGNTKVMTPNIDQLARQGIVFQNAYCNVPLSMPSRASVLTGYRPETINNAVAVTGHVPEGTVTLPGLFKQNGYTTVSIGKIYHKNTDDPEGWTRRYTHTFAEGKWSEGYCSDYRQKENLDHVYEYLYGCKWKGETASNIMEITDKPDESTPDGMTAKYAVEELKRFKESKEPFFLAVGFYRPHMPLTAPKKYWDMYPAESIELPENFNMPACGPREDYNEIRRYQDIPLKGDMPIEKAKQIIRGYQASVSFADVQVGKILQAIKDLKLDRNTIIVLWSDNGWRLGEHNLWSKPEGTECPTRICMIMKAPGYNPQGQSKALVELVDIYPTLAELCHLDAPEYLEGLSVVPLLENRERTWKQAAFSNNEKSTWHAVRTDRYRFIKHKNGFLELYDIVSDPAENINLANDKVYEQVVNEHLELLEKGGIK